MSQQTKRQQILEALRYAELTPRELAREVELPLSRLLAELDHVARSHQKDLQVRPARCLSCGFTFTTRRRLSTPSRCPQCRSERIEGPFLSIAS